MTRREKYAARWAGAGLGILIVWLITSADLLIPFLVASFLAAAFNVSLGLLGRP